MPRGDIRDRFERPTNEKATPPKWGGLEQRPARRRNQKITLAAT
jgi:hypothetical protein